jgi:hypothetical protein
MGQLGRGIAFLILLAIAILIIYCFVLGRCSKSPFGVVPPRPRTQQVNRRSDNDDEDENMDDNDPITPATPSRPTLQSRFDGISNRDASQRDTRVQRQQSGKKQCLGWWDLVCHAQNLIANPISGIKPPNWIPEPLRVAPRIR